MKKDLRITLCRHQKDGTMTFRRWTLEELMEDINSHRYDDVITNFRANYPLVQRELPELRQEAIDMMLSELPQISFARELARQHGETVRLSQNPLVLLKVSNLRSEAYALTLRERASLLPYTCLAFVGADGRSLNIVAEVMALRGDDTEEDISELLSRGAVLLRRVYGDHLHVAFDSEEKAHETMCYMSNDRNTYYNPQPTPFPVDMSAGKLVPLMDDGGVMPWQVENRDERHEWRRIYIDNFRKAQDKMFNALDREYQTLLLLARYCHETGMPQALAEAFTLLHGEYADDPTLVRDTFNVEYEKEMHSVRKDRHLNATALLMRRTRHFLNTHYRFRRNVLNGIVEYRLNDGSDFDYHLLTPEAQNTMTIMALEQGLNSWDKDMNRYLHSNRVPEYDPVNDYLSALPQWDGIDRITALAQRVPTSTPQWERYFHIWMLSMVAQWMGKDDDHGNAIAPILIGAQATGKSSFCRILLPEELMEYYNDSIQFKDDKSVMLALSSFALINIDEFDSLSRSQQPLLKYLLSKTDVKYRAAYKNHIEQHKRYCSFIGTTNCQRPLTDPTGSRRFVCVKVRGNIDFTTPVEHEQLYAQLCHELNLGERYWLTKEEADDLTRQNAVFQRNIDLQAMLLSIFRIPANGEEGEKLTPQEILDALKEKFPDNQIDDSSKAVIGRVLTVAGFQWQRTHSSRLYHVVRL